MDNHTPFGTPRTDPAATDLARACSKQAGSAWDGRNQSDRLAFGLDRLDRHVAGGLRPGTLTVIAGATGAGKTQLGLAWARRGEVDEGAEGVIIDLTSRGDSQNHEIYSAAQRGRPLREHALDRRFEPAALWEPAPRPGSILRPFAHAGRRVTRPDMDPEAWHAWKSDMARVLRGTAAFLYSHFARGTRRVVIDGLEPTEQAADSVQYDFVEYLHHHVLKQDDDWAAREVLREQYRAHEAMVLAHRYDHRQVATVVLSTTAEVLLDDLVAAPMTRGGLLATASTVILMGRTAESGRLGRALCVVKHRGSACRDDFLPYTITGEGIVFPEK